MARAPLQASLAAFALVFTASSFASPARADSASVLGVRESERVPEAVRDAAATAAVAALVDDGVTVRSPADTEAVLTGDPLAECHSIDCAAAVAQRVGADFVVVLSVFGTAEQAASVTVALATADGLSFGGEADITSERPLAQAVADAIAQARVRQGVGTRGTLRVETTVPGATVHIDGRFRGETPLYRALEPGPHQVIVRAEGRVSQTHDVVVSLHAETALRLTLAPTPAPRARTARPWLGPLALGVVGLGALTVDVVALAMTGKDGLTDRSLSWPMFVTVGAVGLGALVTGVLWYALSGSEEPPPASLALLVAPSGVAGGLTFLY